MSSVIAVTGATGSTGFATVQALLKQNNVTVRVAARSTEKAAKFKDLKNVEVIIADSESKEGLAKLFAKADSVLIIPPAAGRVEVALKYVAAAKDAGVKFIALLSVLAAARNTQITFGKQWEEIENAIIKTEIPYSFLRFPFFQENQWGNTGSIKGASAFYYPVKADSRFVHIAISDVGLACAAVLTNPSKHKNTKYSVVGDETSCSDMAKIYSKITGKTVNFYEAKDEDAVKAMVGFGFPEWQAKGIVELWHEANNGNASLGKDGDVFKQLTGQAPITTEAFLTSIGSNFK